MCIKKSISEFKKSGVKVNSLYQLPIDIRILVTEIKDRFLLLYGYQPTITECIFLLENDKMVPDICENTNCNNNAKFNHTKNMYIYCSRQCFYSDKNKQKIIQDKRSGKIDYKEVHKKVVQTKSNTICQDTGMNTHMISAQKALATRNEDGKWKESIIQMHKNITKDERISRGLKNKENQLLNVDSNGMNGYDRAIIKRNQTIKNIINNGYDYYGNITTKSNNTKYHTILENGLTIIDNAKLKRKTTINDRYGGVLPHSGGFSKLKCVLIADYQFIVQGYEDVFIYKLIYEEGYDPSDIIALTRKSAHAIHYMYNDIQHNYYPDIYIKSENRYIEVKSEYWYNKEKEKNDIKIDTAKKLGYNISLYIFTNEDIKDVHRIRKIIERDSQN